MKTDLTNNFSIYTGGFKYMIFVNPEILYIMLFVPIHLPFLVGLATYNASIFVRCLVTSLLAYIAAAPIAIWVARGSEGVEGLILGVMVYIGLLICAISVGYAIILKKYVKLSISKRDDNVSR